jgi:peptide/nickel transport system permease protein
MAQPDTAIPQPALGSRSIRRRSLSRNLAKNWPAFAGGIILAIIILLALSAPILPISNPNQINTINRLQGPGSEGHLLGTDEFGRDILSRLIWGARISLMMGFFSAFLAMVIGVVLGLLSGYYGGAIDTIIMRLLDIMMAFPYILLAIAIVAALGPGLFNAMLAIAIVGIPIYARIIRGSVLSLREKEFVEASRALGATGPRILRYHILPNVIAPIIVAGSLDVGTKIIATAGLSFLGLGTQPPTADWGNMLASGRQFVTVAAHVATIPGLAIVVVVLGLNLIGDWLRDTLDPRLRTE